MERPLLSIGMIVKNEERCLEKCLKALDPLRQAIPCELVIADTGSTDKTKEIATKYADILFDFEWVNDFSKARNAVIDKSTGVWFLSVDADEYLASSIEEIVNFVKNPCSKNYLFASTVIRSYGNVDMTGLYSDFNAVRIVFKDSGVRYSGAIHESLDVTDKSSIKMLANTVFDHDGYVPLSLKHLKEKEKRNLSLLENELEKNPNDIRRILQCLEASRRNIEKNRYFVKYAIKKLKETPTDNKDFKNFGASCAKEIVKSLLSDHDPKVYEFTEWAKMHFPDSYHINIDINHLWTKETYQKEDFEACVKYGIGYLNALDFYRKQKSFSTDDIFISSPDFVHKYYEFEVITILANAFVELGKTDEALQYLEKIELAEADNTSIKNWFNAIYSVKDTHTIAKTVGKVIDSLSESFKKQGDDIASSYNFTLSLISKAFTCKNTSGEDYNVFVEVSDAIGLSVKIANAKSKDEIEKYLNEIKNWNEFMPIALSRAIEFNADLPKGFYRMNSNYCELLISDLMYNTEKLSKNLIENYLNTAKHFEIHQTAFSISFISSILLHKTFNDLTENDKMQFIIEFCESSKVYLESCYNEEFFNNEELVACIPQLHSFGFNLVKAIKLKECDSLEYIKSLRVILKKFPQTKQVIEFLIESFKSEEERKRQEQIKNASPELLVMATQLKTMLAAFPKNSPELLAIKQSPVYQQLKFLIED